MSEQIKWYAEHGILDELEELKKEVRKLKGEVQKIMERYPAPDEGGVESTDNDDAHAFARLLGLSG